VASLSRRVGGTATVDVLALGTGSADGWPDPSCGCASCTAERTERRVRGQTSALVDGTLLLDCGPDTPRAAERFGAGLSRLRHVLITHQDPDRCSPALLLSRRRVDAPLDVVGLPDVVDACRAWVTPESPVTLRAVAPGDRLRLGEYDVRVLAARRASPARSVLYDVTAPGGRLLYAPRTAALPDTTVEAVAGAAFDVVLLEETFGDAVDHGTDHLDLVTFAEQLRRLRAVGAVTGHTDVVAVHLSHHNPPTRELARRLSDWGARVVDDGTRLHTAADDRAGTDEQLTGTRRTLVIGGARSGKSREAERLLATEPEVTYVATSYPMGTDNEWDERVLRHRADRPAHWRTEETLDLAGLLTTPGEPLLVDCLTLWLTRTMDRHDAWDDDVWTARGEKAVTADIEQLVDAWRRTRRRVVAVTNEVGQGLVPETRSGRRFRDVMGRLNAAVAAETEDVRWCVAGRVTSL
jgi:adenosylcobinamide kinase/adenosylcobinamide-phosphate guanylyltransferase